MIKEEYIEKAKDCVPMLTLFKDLYPDAKLRKCGTRYRCNCVFHADSSPSLYIDPMTDLVHCFGCHKTFSRVGLVMENKTMTYPHAIEYLLIKYGNVSNLNEIYVSQSKADEDREKQRESQMIAMQYVQEFYTSQYTEESFYARACRDYAEKRKDNSGGRWDAEKIRTLGFGYAPVSGHALVDWAIKKGINLDTLVDIGVVTCYEDNKSRKCYRDLFRDRLTIPQRNSSGRVIAYTARRLNDRSEKEPKYMNSSCTESNLIYRKGQAVFGIDVARRSGKDEGVMYLVEGAPDVIALYTLGVYNAVASNGGTWSEQQLEKLKPFVRKICFIPDSDSEFVDADGVKVRRGESFVFRSAALALHLGFKVLVKEIPGKYGEKTDVDSYFKTRKLWDSVSEHDFIDWYTAKVYREDDNREHKLESITYICNMLSNIPDVSRRVSYLDDMKEAYPPGKFWDIEMKRALSESQEQLSGTTYTESNSDDTRCYGFMNDNHRYYNYGKNGKKKYWTNFDAHALFHISDEKEVTRIFEITNFKGVRCTIEVSLSNMTKLEKLKEEIEKMGNFRYKPSLEQHELFKDYIYDNMPSAMRLEHVGWRTVEDGGFLAFSNGIAVKGVFYNVDQFGIVEYAGQKYFLPAYSMLYKDNRGAHKILKRFAHIVTNPLTIDQFFSQVIKVYPRHGMQELAFVMATMFLDIIRDESGFFPLMFHYGLTGSGKTQLAITATRFFQRKEEITNIENSSLWALNSKATVGTNVICHHDEYKNDIGKEKMDFCKGTFDNAGRTQKSDVSSGRQQDDIETGQLFTGQEIPNFDPALMTRSILMEFYSSIRTVEETREMEILRDMRDWGVTQLTIEIVSYRDGFKKNWQNVWLDSLVMVKKDERTNNISERIIETWTVLYAVVKCLQQCGLSTPIELGKLYQLCVAGMERQQELLKLTDEVAIFWLLMKNSYRYGEIRELSHFNVKTIDRTMTLKKNRNQTSLSPSKRPILMLCMDACMGIVNHRGIEEKKPVLNEASLIAYLKNTPEYLGTMEAPTKFRMIDRHGMPITEEYIDKKTGETKSRIKRIAERAMIFDYYMVRDRYDIHLVNDYEVSKKDNNNQLEV